MSKTKIINLYGGPGTGKSTSAANLFYHLKCMHLNTELVTEYVKAWAWEGRQININDQIYFLGKQVRKESMLYGKVDWIVTDSPVMMNLFYAEHYCSPTITHGIKELVNAYYKQAEDDGHEHIHILLNRTRPYLQEGRYQTEDVAKQLDVDLKDLLIRSNVKFLEITVGNEELPDLLQKIVAERT